MAGLRTEKIGNQIREILSSALLFEAKDPELRDLSITDVEVSGDLSIAKIYFYSHEESTAKRQRLKTALDRAHGFLRRKLATELSIRITPNLLFYFDETLEKAAQLEKVLQQALAEDAKMKEARGGKPAVEEHEVINLKASKKEKSRLSADDEDDEDDRFDDSDDHSIDDSDDDHSIDDSDDERF